MNTQVIATSARIRDAHEELRNNITIQLSIETSQGRGSDSYNSSTEFSTVIDKVNLSPDQAIKLANQILTQVTKIDEMFV